MVREEARERNKERERAREIERACPHKRESSELTHSLIQGISGRCMLQDIISCNIHPPNHGGQKQRVREREKSIQFKVTK